ILFHLSAPLPCFSTTKGLIFSYRQNTSSFLALNHLREELCNPRNVGSFYSHLNIWNDADDGRTPTHTHHLTPPLTYHPTHITTLALIKRTTYLDPVVPLPTQLHRLNIFGGNETPYESFHTVIGCGVKHGLTRL
ncbi:hypothetical protein K443DRAFT_112333, partial [Laccaria amethystina LaAM-08-1]